MTAANFAASALRGFECVGEVARTILLDTALLPPLDWHSTGAPHGGDV